MAAFLNQNRIGVARVGVTVNVPSNPYSKLMYYLSCVASSLDIRNELAEYTNYAYTISLTLADKKKIVVLCSLFSPDELIGKCWFPNEDIDSSNEFFELSQVTNQLLVTENILIGAHSRRVAKVMFFQRSWMNNNYFNPLAFAINDIRNEGYHLKLNNIKLNH